MSNLEREKLIDGLTWKQVEYFVHPLNYPAIAEKVRQLLCAAVADNSLPFADIMECYVKEGEDHPVFGQKFRNKDSGTLV
jgi:hypothetical protein